MEEYLTKIKLKILGDHWRSLKPTYWWVMDYKLTLTKKLKSTSLKYIRIKNEKYFT